MKKFLYLILLTGLLSFSDYVFPQDTTRSLAFKSNRPLRTTPYFYRPDLAYQIWQQFKLTKEANAGDPLAQHELGLRYLLGDDITADTSQAVYWIKKAADQNLTSAKYNYAILLVNGIGVDWNPFSAFSFFRSAANDGMVQAQYVVGVLYTDNLIIKRNWDIAYYWIKKAADGKYEPAADVINDLEPRISRAVVDSLFNVEKQKTLPDDKTISDPKENLTSSLGLVFIDFDIISDTVYEITDSMLVADIDIIGIDSLKEEMNIDSSTTLSSLATNYNISKLMSLADAGSPEAQTIIGKLYEEGIYFEQDDIFAASYYFRSLRNDSPKATQLLYKLSGKTEFQKLILDEVENDNPVAKFILYGLSSIGFDNRVALSDALDLLEQASNEYYLPAMMELGLNYYTGRFVKQDLDRGFGIWQAAETLGSKEASVRIIASRLFDSFSVDKVNYFNKLIEASDEGSLLAMVSVALSYNEGIGTTKSKAEAVRYLRLAAQRGSQFAYEELKRLYDEIRPAGNEFNLN